MLSVKISVNPFVVKFFELDASGKCVKPHIDSSAGSFLHICKSMDLEKSIQRFFLIVFCWHKEKNELLRIIEIYRKKGSFRGKIGQFIGNLTKNGQKVEYFDVDRIRNKIEKKGVDSLNKLESKKWSLFMKFQDNAALLMGDLSELKKELGLNGFIQSNEAKASPALIGLVSIKNETMLAFVRQVEVSNRTEESVTYVPVKKIIHLLEKPSKPVVLQEAKEADKINHRPAQGQKLMLLEPTKGCVTVFEGPLGLRMTSNKNAISINEYYINLDVLLVYYKIFKYEQNQKDEFNRLLEGAHSYAEDFEIPETTLEKELE